MPLVEVSRCSGGLCGVRKGYRDLNEPDGCRVSSLRKILLLRFRNLLSRGGLERRQSRERATVKGRRVTVPSRSLRQRIRLSQGRLDPGPRLLLRRLEKVIHAHVSWYASVRLESAV
jgi:hypothetical protein